MSRDWMVTGRRPSGLCGAAILIAARIHGYKRTVKQIVNVVNVCDEVIRRRLEEFSNSPVCKMTLNQFESCELQEDGKGNDPPAFIRNRKKEKESEKKQKEMEILKEKAKEIERIFEVDTCDKKNETMNIVDNSETIDTNNATTIHPQSFREDTHYVEDNSKNIVNNSNLEQIDTNTSCNNQVILMSLNSKDKKHQFESPREIKDDEYLSDLEENDQSYYFVSSEEYKLKKILWEVLFKDWIDEQKDKKANEKNKTIQKRPRNLSKNENMVNSTPAEAIMNSNKFSKKLNINVLNKLFSKEK